MWAINFGLNCYKINRGSSSRSRLGLLWWKWLALLECNHFPRIHLNVHQYTFRYLPTLMFTNVASGIPLIWGVKVLYIHTMIMWNFKGSGRGMYIQHIHLYTPYTHLGIGSIYILPGRSHDTFLCHRMNRLIVQRGQSMLTLVWLVTNNDSDW